MARTARNVTAPSPRLVVDGYRVRALREPFFYSGSDRVNETTLNVCDSPVKPGESVSVFFDKDGQTITEGATNAVLELAFRLSLETGMPEVRLVTGYEHIGLPASAQSDFIPMKGLGNRYLFDGCVRMDLRLGTTSIDRLAQAKFDVFFERLARKVFGEIDRLALYEPPAGIKGDPAWVFSLKGEPGYVYYCSDPAQMIRILLAKPGDWVYLQVEPRNPSTRDRIEVIRFERATKAWAN